MNKDKLLEKYKELILHYEKIINGIINRYGLKPEQPVAEKIKAELKLLESEMDDVGEEELRKELIKFAEFKDLMKKIYDITDNNILVNKYLKGNNEKIN